MDGPAHGKNREIYEDFLGEIDPRNKKNMTDEEK